MKVLLLTKYTRMGASSRLRSFQYLPELKVHNLDITVQSLFDDHYLNALYMKKKRSPFFIARLYLSRLIVLFSAYKYDILWIEKEIFPYLPAFAERALRFIGKRYIVDYDDAIFHNYDLSKNPVIRTLLSRKIDVVMKMSHCVVAGNNYLANRARMAGATQVEIVPTVVDISRYRKQLENSDDTIIVGWIGSPSTQKYVVEIASALKKVSQSYKIKVVLVGATPDIVKHFPDINIEVIAWTEESEVDLIRQMDIGIMPLPSGPWEEGKCGYKLIQYMACSVPVIASPVGVNVDIVDGNLAGLLATNLEDWNSTLHKLIESPELRSELGENGRYAVESKYSLHVQAERYREILMTS